MDLHLLYEILKALFMMFEVVHYFIQQKREKTLLATLENHKQRLENLESEFKKLNP